MKRSYSYANGKLLEAIQALALGPGDVRSRLEHAFMSLHILSPGDFPPELQKDWDWVVNQMTRFGPLLRADGRVWMGSVEHTMRRIRNRTGVEIARRICDLFWKLEDRED